MATRAERIVDHFTSDPALKAKILGQVDAVRAGTMTLDQVIAEHTDDPGTIAKIKDITGRVAKGHSVHDIAKDHHSDPAKARSAADRALKHHGVVEYIMNS